MNIQENKYCTGNIVHSGWNTLRSRILGHQSSTVISRIWVCCAFCTIIQLHCRTVWLSVHCPTQLSAALLARYLCGGASQCIVVVVEMACSLDEACSVSYSNYTVEKCDYQFTAWCSVTTGALCNVPHRLLWWHQCQWSTHPRRLSQETNTLEDQSWTIHTACTSISISIITLSSSAASFLNIITTHNCTQTNSSSETLTITQSDRLHWLPVHKRVQF